MNKLLNYLKICPFVFASFFLASRDVIAKKLYCFRYHDIYGYVIPGGEETLSPRGFSIAPLLPPVPTPWGNLRYACGMLP